MKKALITGGTGFIGSNLTKELKRRGYIIYLSSRSNNTTIQFSKKFDFLKLEKNEQIDIMEECDIIINLAGAGIADKRWTSEYKKVLFNSRLETTSAIAEAINRAKNPPEVFISASAVGYYGDRNTEILHETSSKGEGFLADLCFEWERAANLVNDKTRVVSPRIGVVLHSKTGALPKMLIPFKLFLGGSLGSGNQFVSWIHLSDVIKIFLYIIENSNIRGAVNMVAPEPVNMKEFAKIIGQTLKRPYFFPVPEFILNTILGESSVIVTDGQRVMPDVLQKSQFSFTFNNIEIALKDLLRK